MDRVHVLKVGFFFLLCCFCKFAHKHLLIEKVEQHSLPHLQFLLKFLWKGRLGHPWDFLRSSLLGVFVVKPLGQFLRDPKSRAVSNFGALSDLSPKQFDFALFGGAKKGDFT